MDSAGGARSELDAIRAVFGERGAVAAAARTIDWSNRPAGPVRGWPPLLRSIVRFAMDSPHATAVLWGQEALAFWNDRAASLFSSGVEAALGESWFARQGERSAEARALHARVLNGEVLRERGRNVSAVREGRTEDAWFDLEYTPIYDSSGNAAGVLQVARERSDEIMTGRQHEFLARLSDALRPIIEPSRVEEAATRLLGTELGVARVMYGVVESDGEHIRFARSYVAPGVPELHGRFRMSDFGQRLVTALRAGESLVSDSIDADGALAPAERDAYLKLGIQALAGVPLIKDGRLVANISVHDVKPRRWTNHDLELIAETAQRTWSAVERARAEAALRDSEERYRSLFETMQEGYVQYAIVRSEDGRAMDARFVEVNRVFVAFTGVPRERCIGRLRSEVLPDVPAETLNDFVRAVETGEPARFEVYASATGCWYDVRVHPGPDDRVVVLYDDVTARKQAEQALRETDARNTYLLDLSDRLRAVADPIELQNVSTALLAERLQAVRCYFSEYDLARGLAQVQAESVRGDAPSAIGTYQLSDLRAHVRTLQQGRPLIVSDWQQNDAYPVAKQLLPRRARAYVAVPLVKRGVLLGCLVVDDVKPRQWTERDIDFVAATAERTWPAVERARAEQALRESEQLARVLLEEATAARALAEGANRAKDEFLAILGHELRTPLAAILLWARTLRSTRVDPAHLARAVDAIVQSADSQSRLIDDLLDLSRLNAGKLALSVSPLDVRALLDHALEMVRPLATGKSLSLSADIGDVGIAVFDGTRLKQILWNLLTNAVKFTPEGGSVIVRAAAQGGMLVLEVEDSGEGIAPDFLPHVFEKFRQAEMGDARRHMGLGIGLTLAKQLAELHGGTIAAASQGIGHGALFRVTLPLVSEGSMRREAGRFSVALGATPLDSLRVLLVEDDANTRWAMQFSLERAGAKVVPFDDAKQALAALDSTLDADVLVCDLGLPGISGVEFIEQLGRRYQHRGIELMPSCAVSAHARDVDREEAIAAGFDMYLSKPLTPERLVEAVAELRQMLGVTAQLEA